MQKHFGGIILKHKHTRSRSILLTLVMLAGLLPWAALGARAEGEEPVPVGAASGFGTQESDGSYSLESKTYQLTADITLDGTLLIQSGTTAALDLNGYTLTGNGAGSLITVEGAFTLTDGSENGTGRLTGGAAEMGGGV